MARTWVLTMVASLLLGMAARATDLVVLVNKNLPECRQAADASVEACRSEHSLKGSPVTLELDGSEKDGAALGRLKGLDPRVVISTGAWATREARRALPQAWIIHVMVPYPEVEGFIGDRRMLGISPLGLEKDLFAAANALKPVKRLAVVHSDVLSPSVGPLLDRLRGAGFEPEDFPLSQAPLLAEVMGKVAGRFEAVLLLPDPVTENPYALRFLITKCVEGNILTLSVDQSLVQSGVLCASYLRPETSGARAAALAAKLMTAGQAPMPSVLFAASSKIALNLSAARSFGLRITLSPDLAVQ